MVFCDSVVEGVDQIELKEIHPADAIVLFYSKLPPGSLK